MGRLRFIITATGLLLLSIALLTGVQADDGDTYSVGTNSLNVRTAPSNNAKIMGTLSRDDQISVFQKQYGWAQTYYDGDKGWVASQYLMPEEQKETTESTDDKDDQTDKQETTGPLNGYTIVLDPGHGGEDPGASGIDGFQEKEATMTAADATAEKLRNEGATVILTRSDDTYVSLNERVNISNENKTDAFISLHYDAYLTENVNGFSTHYVTNGSDKALATDMQSALKQTMEIDNRGIKQNGYHVLSENADLAVLVELGFVTSPDDMSAITTDEHQENVANGIVDGVKDYFNE